MKEKNSPIFKVGRRKTSIARVKLQFSKKTSVSNETPTKNIEITVNNRKINEYFTIHRMQKLAVAPLEILENTKLQKPIVETFCIKINVNGGGITGQADACSLGIARSLEALNPEMRIPLKRAGLLKRDPRSVERKKYGLHKARRATQFSKR